MGNPPLRQHLGQLANDLAHPLAVVLPNELDQPQRLVIEGSEAG
jgi:hypothetical protein